MRPPPSATKKARRVRTRGWIAGTITIAVRGAETPGEVELPINGGSATYIAYGDEPIPRGAGVVVIDVRPNRKVDVTRL